MLLSCHFYDQLEIAAMRQQKVRLSLKPGSFVSSVYEGRIKDLVTRNGEEFLITDTRQTINLSAIQKIEILSS